MYADDTAIYIDNKNFETAMQDTVFKRTTI